MQVRLQGQQRLRGEVILPADKSMLHRALILGALSAGETQIMAGHFGDDNRRTLANLQALGASLTEVDGGFAIVGNREMLSAPCEILDCGNSATTMRLLLGVCAGLGIKARFDGDASLRTRSMQSLIDVFAGCGIDIVSQNGCAPLELRGGTFKGGEVVLPHASAQLKSAVLLAALVANEAVQVIEPGESRDHTERMLAMAGVQVEVQRKSNATHICLSKGQKLKKRDWQVPGDFSSASFLLAAALGLPDSEIIVRGVGLNGTRTGFLEILQEYGAEYGIEHWSEGEGEALGDVWVKSSKLNAKQAGDKPTRIGADILGRLLDEVPVLAVLATQAVGVTQFCDLGPLRNKESDRVQETAKLLEAFGARIEIHANRLDVYGPTTLKATQVEVGHDHRLALCAFVLALLAEGESTLNGFESVEVSFPGFRDILKQLEGGSGFEHIHRV
ncbi:MAG: 3-phosphoshikimate 1-carboxyvinyltransferase [Myxococcota bacterium]|jgi:3-phosphoshikimate 1-carboxyvinyltransferase|nr:3-phosphoshikimate 1-carboxyvinyltransferase [Myxococcota bacterium]